jgi:two-component system OmpR family sensor kinase
MVMLEPVDLGGVVEMLAGEIGHLAVSTGHELRTAIDDDVWCLGDDARILQIGRALATNAMTHTPAGTTVTLRARRRSDRAELSVEDDGPGIPETQQEAVFARFYRVEGGMASGSGLGLAIAREIARIMGGDVRLDSEGQPTRFTLDLPAEPIPPGAPRSTQVFSRENAAPAPERVPQG